MVLPSSPNQNLRQIGQRVPELLSDTRTKFKLTEITTLYIYINLSGELGFCVLNPVGGLGLPWGGGLDLTSFFLSIYFSNFLSRYDELDASGVGLDPERKQKSLGQIQVLRDTGTYTEIQEDTGETGGYTGIQEIQGDTGGYTGIQGHTLRYRRIHGDTGDTGNTGGYTGIQGDTGGYTGIQGDTGGYTGIHWDTRGYRSIH